MLVDARIQFVQLIDAKVKERAVAHQARVDTVKDAFNIGAAGEQPLRQRVGEKLGVRGRRLGLACGYETAEAGEFVRAAETVLPIPVTRRNTAGLAGLKCKVLR